VRYRTFGSLDWMVSVLGFSVSELPLRAGDPGEAARAEWVRLLRYAIDHGVNYLDLGHPYDPARQETLLAVVEQALRDGYRDKVKVALTVPVSGAAPAGDLDSSLNRQLEWLKTDRVDFCLLGRVDRENWVNVRGPSFLGQAEAALTDGRVSYLGFAFHDHFQILRKVLKEYDRWTVAQFQFSYMDIAHDPGAPGLAYAAEQGLAVVVTEPLKRGQLVRNPPATVAGLWAAAPAQRSLAEWGLRFVWSHSAVCTAVCGVTTLEQLAENIALADQAEVGVLTVREELTFNRVRDAYHKLRAINCASCRPCMPCPQGIDMPRIFELYNDALMYGDVKTAASIYREEGHRAEDCVACGMCERKCARRYPVPIIDWLDAVDAVLGTGGPWPADRPIPKQAGQANRWE
jgi:predicted aldo/keto reductase-like oxidoreductase